MKRFQNKYFFLAFFLFFLIFSASGQRKNELWQKMADSEIKAFEALVAVEDGAVELDMVLNIGAMKSSEDSLVKRDISGVVESADGMVVKVILETALLTDQQIIRACILSKEAEADYVKTSTGIGYPGANTHNVALMRETVGPDMGVKASGGIRNLKTVVEMIDNGASKIGTSTGPAIMNELLKK